jgi:transcriptional regulator with XRE-family HTH domain
MGVSEATVQNWESGRSNPLPRHLRKLLKLAKDFDIGVEKLVEKKILQQKIQ